MKKTILILLLLPFMIKSQIEMKEKMVFTEVGKVKNGASTDGKIEYTVSDASDTAYIFMFRNLKYPTMSDFKTVSFYGENTLNELYKIMYAVFLEENKNNKDYDVSFKLGKTDVSVRRYKTMGILTVWFESNGAYVYFSEKQLKKLFGKPA